MNLPNREDYMDFIKRENHKGWVVDPQNIHAAGWGLSLTTTDMAKIGQLYLNNGIWNKQRVISSQWIEESTQVHIRSNDLAYGECIVDRISLL